jgi:hypothetical protein
MQPVIKKKLYNSFCAENLFIWENSVSYVSSLKTKIKISKICFYLLFYVGMKLGVSLKGKNID